VQILPDRDPLTGVTPSRHPFQFWVLFFLGLSGATVAFNLGQPGSLTELMPQIVVRTWGATVMLGGIVGIAAGWWKDRITGLLLERIALAAVGGMTGVYGFVLMGVAGGVGIFSGFLALSVTVASFWRIIHVNRELKVLTRWIEQNL